jgi:4-oxalocrotonate tautomerase
MPIIEVKIVEGVFDADQKQALLPRLTDAVEAVHPGLRDVTFITIEEVPSGLWGIAGEPITPEKVAAHARKNIQARR